jgi:hypothetical protein
LQKWQCLDAFILLIYCFICCQIDTKWFTFTAWSFYVDFGNIIWVFGDGVLLVPHGLIIF